MGSGQLAYGDDWVRDGKNTYARKDGMIKYNGKWHEEGSMVFPWEKRAKKAEKLAPDGRSGSSAYQQKHDV